MYVTLEPCNHHGKTPPCVDAILANGIAKVVMAMKDPNPLTSGAGTKRLGKAGVKVVSGVMEKEARELNRKYIKFMEKKMPYVTVKLAQSLDGKIAARDGSSKWISSGASRDLVKKMRGNFDAIMVGVNTVLKDDPYLLDRDKKGYSTSRVVVDTTLKTPADSRLVKTTGKSPLVIITTEKAPKRKIELFRSVEGLRLIELKSSNGKVPLKAALRRLAGIGVVNLLVEGGGELVGALLDERLVDEAMFFIAPRILGGTYSSIKGKGVASIDKAFHLENMEIKRSGGDIFVTGRVSS